MYPSFFRSVLNKYCSFNNIASTRFSTIKGSTMSSIRTFVFFDLETTGLPQFEFNQTKITEMCAIAVQADHIELGVFPRVHNKLAFCFNPAKMINPEASSITGLYNDLLEHQPRFDSGLVDMLNNWINMCRKPICFVAHNGNRFDYPIIRTEVSKTGKCLDSDILCVDSLVAFRSIDKENETQKKAEEGESLLLDLDKKSKGSVEVNKGKDKEQPFEFDDGFDDILLQALDDYEKSVGSAEKAQKINETTPKKQMIQGVSRIATRKHHQMAKTRQFKSYKLGDVYKRLTDKEPINSHAAEGDVSMLIMCAAVYGEKFTAYANSNSKLLTEIPKMEPGKPIGT